MATVFRRVGSDVYYARFRDHGRWLTRTTGLTDRDDAQRKADKLELAAEVRRESGVEGQIADESRRAIEDHLPDYEAKLKTAKHWTPDHVARTLDCIRNICKLAGVRLACDLSADRINRAAVQLREHGIASKQKGVKQRPLSLRTVHAYLTAVKGFSRWLAKTDKLPRDPLASVQKPNPDLDRRIERRMLLPDEWQWLKTTTLAGGDAYGMPARERVLCYATAIQTGLRAGELRSLTRARLFLDGKTPYITCKARSTKNRKEARQYIQPELAAELTAHIRTKTPTAPLFGLPSKWRMADMLRDDLTAARKAWLKAAPDADERMRREQSDFLAIENHDGEVLDFHALRHTCGAWLAMAGAPVKAVQAVMRHSTITLTMDRYGHLFPGQEADTVARLPAMMGDAPHLKATGTEGGGAAKAQQNPCDKTQLVASADDDASPINDAEPVGDESTCDATSLVASELKMRLLGLEPKTYGLKVRCSTN
jgi:integrase